MRQIAAIRRCDTSPRLYCCCDKALALSLSLRYVARIQTSLNSCDRSQRQNSVAATMIFTCHTRRFVAATCRGDVSQRFVASYVSAFNICRSLPHVELGSFNKSRRRRQRKRQQTNALMSKAIAMHVRFESWYIALPSSTN